MRTGGITFLVRTTGTGVPDGDGVAEVSLGPPTPNPSEGSVGLSFALPAAGRAQLSIYDLSGRLVATLFSGDAQLGQPSVTWDGRDGSGTPASSGVYFAKLQAAGETRVAKLVLIR